MYVSGSFVQQSKGSALFKTPADLLQQRRSIDSPASLLYANKKNARTRNPRFDPAIVQSQAKTNCYDASYIAESELKKRLTRKGSSQENNTSQVSKSYSQIFAHTSVSGSIVVIPKTKDCQTISSDYHITHPNNLNTIELNLNRSED